MKRILLSILLSAAIAAPTHAELKPEQATEIISLVERFCKDASASGSIVEYEGDAAAGGTIRLLGLGIEGKVSGQQFNNIQGMLGNPATDPTLCKFEILEVLLPAMDGADDRQIQQLTDTCQSTASILVCVKTDEMRRMGSRVFVPITYAYTGTGSQFTIQTRSPAGYIYTDTGEEHEQPYPGGATRAMKDEVISQVFEAELSKAPDVETIAVKIDLSTPQAEFVFFDIFLQ